MAERAPEVDYHHCRYDESRLMFRGPRRRLDGQHIVAIGSTATYGRFVHEPWPAALEKRMGRAVANLGYPNAGIDLVNSSQTLRAACAGAAACVVEVMGAANMSNRFYSVHPRHNDRFLMPSHELGRLYPEVDFTEFAFVRHMLGTLESISPQRFRLVLAEMRDAWAARTRVFLDGLEGPAILLRISRGERGDPATGGPGDLPPRADRDAREGGGARRSSPRWRRRECPATRCRSAPRRAPPPAPSPPRPSISTPPSGSRSTCRASSGDRAGP